MSRAEDILRKILRNHSVEFVRHSGDDYANFGGSLAIQVTPEEREYINELDEEEN